MNPGNIRECLVSVSKQQFSVFKQYFTYFYIFFHSYVFPQKFLNNNFQFLNTCIKRTLDNAAPTYIAIHIEHDNTPTCGHIHAPL